VLQVVLKVGKKKKMLSVPSVALQYSQAFQISARHAGVNSGRNNFRLVINSLTSGKKRGTIAFSFPWGMNADAKQTKKCPGIPL